MINSLHTKRAFILLLSTAISYAQLSSSAYRALGQVDLRQNGLNMVQGTELNGPSGLALDARGGQTHVYVADTNNARVLAWADVSAYQIGDAPSLVLGQPAPQYSSPLGIGTKGFNGPLGVAVDPATGNLYVADLNNNRVLRFLSPFANPSRVEPDAVFGQPSFTTNTAGTSNTTLNQPRAVAFDPSGNLWVADTGNQRIVRFAAATLNSTPPPAADTVIGQKDFVSSGANGSGTVSASGFDTPAGLAFDAVGNLYVSDFRNARVLKFPAPLGPSTGSAVASSVWGQSNFAAHGALPQGSASTIAGPVGLSVDGNGHLYVAVPGENRVLIFPANATVGGVATNVIGQPDFTTTTANTGVFPLTSASTLFAPTDVKVDSGGNLFIADTGNNRVVEFPANSKTASKVWGQSDFGFNGPNQLKPSSINFPYKMAIDYSAAPFALYVSDTANNRVLIWKDSVRFQSGDPADLVVGQPSLRTGAANVDTHGGPTPSATSLSGPRGIAVDPASGALYVADSGNNRILRYPRPVSQSGRITPDAVIGQVDFVSATSAAVTGSALNSPGGLAIGPNGDLFVADSGNSRVLEFPAGAGNGATAIRVYGQQNFVTSSKPSQVSAQTLISPQGVFVDQASNLYVADTGANRIMIFPNTQSAPTVGMVATFVVGQGSFTNAANSLLKSPSDVAVDSNGNIYVADGGNNRVLEFQSLVFLPVAGAAPTGVIGQQTTTGTAANWDSSAGLAAADSLYFPVGLYVDRQDTLYVGDAGNSRVLQFLKSAGVVNAATYQSGVPVGQGSLATLFSSGLASSPVLISATTWPTVLLNRQLVINDSLPAPIYYLDPGQVNFQLPTNAPLGSDRVAVRVADTGELVAGGTLLVAAASPGLFTSNQGGTGQAAVVNQDGTLNGPGNPAPIGSTILIYGTGQGQVSPAVPDGNAAPSLPLSNTVAVPTSDGKACLNSQPSMCVALGNAFGAVKYSGLAPGYIGLWQINVTIPAGITTGTAVPLRVVINGTPSNVVTVAVR